MLVKSWTINILLAATTIFFATKAYDVWSSGEYVRPVPQQVNSPADPQGRNVKSPRKARLGEFAVVAQKNLFSPDRKEAEVTPQTPATKPQPQQGSLKQFVLYGVVLAGDRSSALISHPRERGKKGTTSWVKKGDVLFSMTVSDIRADRIVFEKDDALHEILLYDQNKPKKRGGVKAQSGPVVVTSEGPAKRGPKGPVVDRRVSTKTPRKSAPTPAGTKRSVKRSPAANITPEGRSPDKQPQKEATEPIKRLLEKLAPQQD